jgi:uncharacterized protein YbgA (DUF1722 family)
VRLGKKCVSAEEKRELGGLIGTWPHRHLGRGLVPLVMPITLFNRYVARCGLAYVADEIYVSPHPKELMPP